jgi:hypothetical protein
VLGDAAFHQHPHPGGTVLDTADNLDTAKATHDLRYSTAQFALAGTDALANLEHIGAQIGCKPASWYWTTDYDYTSNRPRLPILTGHIRTSRPAATRQAAQQWANVLGLTPSTKARRGTVSYDGEIDGLNVQIWAVVDDKAFSSKLAMARLWMPDLILTGLLAASAAASCVLLARHNKITTALRR